MRRLVCLWALCASAAHPAGLTPYFGVDSQLSAAGDVQHGGTIVECSDVECALSEGGSARPPQFAVPPWDGGSDFFVGVVTNLGHGYFSMLMTISGAIVINCTPTTEDCSQPLPLDMLMAFDVGMGSLLDLMVDVPRGGLLAFDRYHDGQFVSREIRPVGPGAQLLTKIQEGLAASARLDTVGIVEIDERKLVEVRNIQFVPEPSTFTLFGASVAAMMGWRVGKGRQPDSARLSANRRSS